MDEWLEVLMDGWKVGCMCTWMDVRWIIGRLDVQIVGQLD